MKQIRIISIIAVGALAFMTACSAVSNKNVCPMIGTDFTGHTFPGAILPFGMVSASPDTGTKDWTHCSGYHYDDSSIEGFSQTHLSGTGATDMCDLLLMPVTGKPIFEVGTPEDPDSGYRSRFSHESEEARAGYYAVTLNDYNIRAEVTVTERCPFYRFEFPKGEQSGIIFDMTHGNDSETYKSNIECIGDNAVSGYRRSRGFIHDHVYYFYAEFSEPIIDSDRKGESKLYVRFEPGDDVLVRMGVSTVSVEGAKVNLRAEIPHWNFEKTLRSAEAKWADALSKINAEFANEDEKTIFYTALYHSLIAPNLITDVDGKYRGWDGEVHESKYGDLYTNYSLWDTYRAVHPLYNIIEPERNVDFINSMLERYCQIGSLPINEYGTCETYCMIGYHAVSVIADAILQELEGFDYELAFEAMCSIAEDPARGVGYYKDMGYIPSEKENNSVSKVLEYAYDDWCIAEAAKKLGKHEAAEYYYKRSLNYRNVYDSEAGFVRGRMEDGSWREPFNPVKTSGLGHDDFTEGSAWQYTFYVPHDLTNYIAMNGGDEAFDAKLDECFTTELSEEFNDVPDITGLIGQYAHGNEPSHNTAYLYNFIGKPWKTQEMIARIKREMYSSAPDGLCGNDDCGQMSSWYIFSALGFYPVNPGSGVFVIGTPSVKKAEIVLPGGRTLNISAPEYSQDNIYVKGVMLNGKPYTKSYITSDQINGGAEIEFIMASKPNKEWGLSTEDRPVSLVEIL